MRQRLAGTMVLVAVVLWCANGALAKERRATNVEGGPSHHQRALTYRDPASGVIFYVETDGRHVSGISPNGKLLWTRDPFREAGLEPYRVPYPRIYAIGSAEELEPEGLFPRGENRIRVEFDSSQFGDLDVETGKFTFLGQD